MNTFTKDAIIAYHSIDGAEHDIRIGYRIFSVWTLWQVIFYFGTVTKARKMLGATKAFGLAYKRTLYIVFEY